MKVFFSPKYTAPGNSWWTNTKPEKVFRELQKETGMEYSEVKKPMEDLEIFAFHTPHYLRGMDLSYPESLESSRYRSQGQFEACKEALDGSGCTFNLSSGFHHAEPESYQGFCMLNGLVLAHTKLRKSNPNIRTAVIDLDAHYGNGCDTYSRRDLNFKHFDISTEEPRDFRTYMTEVIKVLKAAKEFEPDLVQYNAGMDVLEGDSIGNGFLTLEQAAIRDRNVLGFCEENEIPIAVCLAGGYQDDAIEGHLNTFREAQRLFG